MFSIKYIEHQFEECVNAEEVVKKHNEIINSIGFLIKPAEEQEIAELAAREFSKKRRAAK